MLTIGLKGEAKTLVTEEKTAKAYGSGALRVFATPAMIALIEQTAWQSVAPHLAAGEGTVGTKLEISHLAPTPVGQTVRCETELIEIDRRRLVFSAAVYDACGKIGEGRHERFIIQNEKFQRKADEKAAQL